MVLFVSGGVWADPVQVWVQPDGDTFANAYALQGEARTYFGRAECNACGALEYRWEASDGSSTAFAGVGDPRYIEWPAKTFAAFGTQWARLTVREAANPGNSATAQVNLQVIAAGSDTLNRQKNSAIDRGLRYMYQNEQVSGNTSWWGGSGSPYGSTGMSLVAFENHGHNLQAPDSDIYKKTVQRGVQYLLESASMPALTNQRCIGDPEANDGDSDHDGLGVLFGGDDLYTNSIAVLALVNSADQAYAQSNTVTTGNALNGMSFFDIAVDAKDWLAWAQNDGGAGGGATTYCVTPDGSYLYAYYGGLDVTDVQGYFWSSNLAAIGGCGGTFHIDWGDGNTTDYVDNQMWCPYGDPNMGYPELSYYDPGPTHTYGADGSYTINFSYDAGGILTPLCGAPITVAGAGAACGAADAMSGAGGWRYSSNYGDSDNSVTQWPVLALSEAKNRWGIDVNPEVVTMLGHWLGYSQCTNGAFGYTAPESWCNFPKAAAGLIMLHYDGKPSSDPAVVNVLNFLDSNWNTFGYDYNFNNHYSQYALYKAMKVWGISNFNGRDWEAEYDQDLINRQNGDGSWYDGGGWMDPLFATFAAVAILAPEVATLPPVANAGGPYPAINAGQNLLLNGANSYHQDPAKNIVSWEWDFDAANGLWWDTLPAPGAGEGAVGIGPTVSYPDLGHDQAYTVTLRVKDDTSPVPMTDTDTAVVNVTSGNVPPVPVTNGPWTALPNTDIVFDGMASYDPNDPAHCSGSTCLGDSIVSYEWDLDGDGNWNEGNGDDGTPLTGNWSQVKKAFANPISLPARLRVTDSFGLQGISSDQLNIVSIAVVYGQQYQTCFRQVINRFEERLGLSVLFKNQGNATAQNLIMTLTSAPSNLTILDGVANLGDVAAGAEVTTTCDPATMMADIELRSNRRIIPTGDWRWRADFDFNGSHYTVDNIPPLGP